MNIFEKTTVLGMAVCAASVVACGSTERTEDSGSRAVAGVALLDNMEDGNTQTLADEAGYKGFWYTYDDKGECDNMIKGGTTWPPPETPADFAMTEYASLPADFGGGPDEPPGEANTKAVRFTGGGHSVWGAGIGFQLAEGAKYDLSQFSGVRFWGRSPSGEQAVTVKIPDAASTPADGMCVARDPATCMPPKQGCFADPQATVTFKTTWEPFMIPFGDFVRPDYGVYKEGVTPLTTLDPTTAYQLQFQVGKVAMFDIFIDNVGLILKNPPAAPAP